MAFGATDILINNVPVTCTGDVTLELGSYFDGVNWYNKTPLENNSSFNPQSMRWNPVTPKASFSWRLGDRQAITQILSSNKVNVTLRLPGSAKSHFFTNAEITEMPSVNLSTGEVSNFKIELGEDGVYTEV